MVAKAGFVFQKKVKSSLKNQDKFFLNNELKFCEMERKQP
jgi:hypothetical protein